MVLVRGGAAPGRKRDDSDDACLDHMSRTSFFRTAFWARTTWDLCLAWQSSALGEGSREERKHRAGGGGGGEVTVSKKKKKNGASGTRSAGHFILYTR